MANEHIKPCSASLTLGKWKSKPQWDTTLYHCYVKNEKKCWWDWENFGTLCIAGGKVENATVGNSWLVPHKGKLGSPCDPAVPFVGVHTKHSKAGSRTDRWAPVFIAALLSIVEIGNNPCVWTVDWVNNMWYMPVMEYCSAFKRKEILIYLQHGWTLRIIC